MHLLTVPGTHNWPFKSSLEQKYSVSHHIRLIFPRVKSINILYNTYNKYEALFRSQWWTFSCSCTQQIINLLVIFNNQCFLIIPIFFTARNMLLGQFSYRKIQTC
jgi:hypothetical protein